VERRCQAMPFASTFVGHRTISSILEVLALLLVYERCARCVLGMTICGACMASPARLVRVWPRRPPTKGTDGGGRIECDPCPRCNHAVGDRGRTALQGKGMALSERGIEALARSLEQRTRRPQEDRKGTGQEAEGGARDSPIYYSIKPAIPAAWRGVIRN
jgi:hypothetical protein